MLFANSTIFIFVALSIYESVLYFIFNLKKDMHCIVLCAVLRGGLYLVLKLLKTRASKIL